MKRLILLAAVLAALAAPSPSAAESVCADAGASNPTGLSVPSILRDQTGISIPAVCVWVP